MTEQADSLARSCRSFEDQGRTPTEVAALLADRLEHHRGREADQDQAEIPEAIPAPTSGPTVTLTLDFEQIEALGFALTRAKRDQEEAAKCWARGSVPHEGYASRARRIEKLRGLLDAACIRAGA